MNKKLAAKIQKLVPLAGESENVFSSSIDIEPTERDLVLKKGSVYTVFDINSPVPLNVPLITKVVNDVLYDSYYHSENISPIQSLEKAVVNINEKISTLAAEKASDGTAAAKKDAKMVFNIVSCVLWGNVLYLVQYGKGKSFLMREGEVKEVSATSEGNFSVASGVVKNGDVIVLCTENFAKKYPPNKLLDSALSSNDLDPDNASIILKFMVDEEFTEDEMIDFNVKPDKKATKIPNILKGFKDKKAERKDDQAIESLVDSKPEPAPKSAVVQTKNEGPNIKVKKRREPKIKLNMKALTVVVGVLLVFSVVITLIIRNNQGVPDDQTQDGSERGSSLFVPREFNRNEDQPTEEPQTAQEPQQQEQTEDNTQQQEDITNKVVRIDAQPFYDLKLADENASPTDIAVFNNTVVVTDSSSGKVFTSGTDAPKFTALEQSFSGIQSVVNYDGQLNFSDDEGYKAYDLTDNTVADSFTGAFGLTSRYLGNIYSLEGNKIVKYVPEGDALTSSDWGTDEALAGAKDIDIAFSIYVLSQDNELLVYTQGEKASFSITGLPDPLSNVTALEVDNNYDYIYLADAGNNRVVVLNDSGEFVKQIKASQNKDWPNIRDIGIDPSESTMFVLSGSKVFEVDLTEADVPQTEAAQQEEAAAEESSQEEAADQ